MAWSSEFYQFAAFTPPQDKADAFQLWLETFGSPPDNYQRAPDLSIQATMATGSYAGYQFQLQSSPGRIDLFLMGTQGANGSAIINAEEAAANLLKDRVGILGSSRAILRLALISQVFEDTPSLGAATTKFCELTGLPNIPPNSQDLNFGINLRKEFDNPRVTFNRWCRWVSSIKQLVQLQIGPAGLAEQLPSIEQPSIIFNLDLNTVVRPLPFSANAINGVIALLFDETARLRSGGYAYLAG